MNVMVAGSRPITDYDFVSNNIRDILIKNNIDISNITIISGGAKGVDLLAKRFALENNTGYLEFLPNWGQFGKSAGIKRNIEMLENSNFIICFWDGKSKGTKFVINYCNKKKVPFEVVINEPAV